MNNEDILNRSSRGNGFELSDDLKTQGEILRAVFSSLKQRRQRWTKSAFAKFLEMPAPRLHDFMHDKRILTDHVAERIIQKLHFNENEKTRFLQAIEFTRSRSTHGALTVKISLEQYKEILGWQYFAILSLAETYDFRLDPAWIGRRLDLSEEDARSALAKLQHLGILQQSQGRTVQARIEIDKPAGDIDRELIISHQKLLQRTLDHLVNLKRSEILMKSLTISCDPRKLPEAIKMADRFMPRMVSKVEKGRRSEVYNLTLQLIPLSQSDN